MEDLAVTLSILKWVIGGIGTLTVIAGGLLIGWIKNFQKEDRDRMTKIERDREKNTAAVWQRLNEAEHSHASFREEVAKTYVSGTHLAAALAPVKENILHLRESVDKQGEVMMTLNATLTKVLLQDKKQ